MFDKINVLLEPSALMPTRAHDDDAGLDLYTPFFAMVPPHGRCVIDTGVHVGIPDGFVGKLESKSGLMRKAGITCRGTIDAGYTGTSCIVRGAVAVKLKGTAPAEGAPVYWDLVDKAFTATAAGALACPNMEFAGITEGNITVVRVRY